jgi:phosphatidylinositol alpha-mannosyltransferase
MRIAFVSPYDWCIEGGVKNHITHLASYFRQWGHEVAIFAPASEPEAVAGEITVMGRAFGVSSSGSVARVSFNWMSPDARDALAAGKFDVVHLHEPLVPLLPYHFMRYSRSVNVGTFHAAKEGGSRFYSYTMFLTRRWYRKLHGKIAVSSAAAALISRYYAGYFNIIPNGIEYDHFAAPHEPFAEFMDGRHNILFVGRPEKRKGLKYLLRAYLQLRQQEPNSRLIIVGAGDFSRYETLMRPFPDIVFRSNVPYDELPRYHHSAELFCSPATGNESQGIALLEGMAAGVAVVASNIEGFAGVIVDEAEGLLVKPKDDEALAAALLRLIRNPALRRTLAQQGQAKAVNYRWDHIARRVLSYYERLLYERQQVAEVAARRRRRAETVAS